MHDKHSCSTSPCEECDGMPESRITIVTPDDPNTNKIGFMVYERGIDDQTPDYDAEVLSSTDAADQYLNHHGHPFKRSDRTGYTSVKVLTELTGRPWDQYALNMIQSCRPSALRVTTGDVTSDSFHWRVTVFLSEDKRTIKEIVQEVEVGLTGAKHGHGLNKYASGASPKPQNVFYNARGLNKLNLTK